MRAKIPAILFAAWLLCTPAVARGAVPGPIKVSPNGRYFVDRDGKPFFLSLIHISEPTRPY